MSSRDGMLRADLDTGLCHDRKVVALARLQRSPERTATTLMLYVATVLASWREDRPETLDDSVPAWFGKSVERYRADLVSVGLLDEDGRIPVETLDRWMASARARVAGGRSGAASRWQGNGYPLGARRPPNANSQEAKKPRSQERARPKASDRTDGDGSPVESFGEIMTRLGVPRESLGGGE